MKFPVKFYFGNKVLGALRRSLSEEKSRNKSLTGEINKAVDSCEIERQKRISLEQGLKQLEGELSQRRSSYRASEAINQSNAEKIVQLEAEVYRLREEHQQQLHAIELKHREQIDSLSSRHESELSKRSDAEKQLLSAHRRLLQNSELGSPIFLPYLAMVPIENPFYAALIAKHDYGTSIKRIFISA